jgi:uncharacterized membrane protein
MSSEAISQSEIIRKNISAISDVQREEAQSRTLSDRISDYITEFSGSMAFLIIHAIWFGLWIVLNLRVIHIPGVRGFDPFPFGLLTMIVSLEAIFLSTFVLISQNRMTQQSEQRAELDLHINLLAEQKATKVLEMLDKIAQQLDKNIKSFNISPDPEVEALKVSPEPQEVLQVMKETVNEQAGQVREEVVKVVEKITGEMEAMRGDVKQIDEVKEEVGEINEKIEAVGTNVQQIKEDIKERRGKDDTAMGG